jgi:pectate lyase
METTMKYPVLVAGMLLASSAHAAPIDAKTLVGASTPLQVAQYGVRNYSPPVLVGGLHDPASYAAAPKLPAWQFAAADPTGGVLTFERNPAPATGWHAQSRKGAVLVTGGGSAIANRIYTVYNGQQLVAAINQAGNDPKIIRVIGHIDLRWSQNNTVFREYTSYSDQKYGGSIALPSNTTLVGINDAQGRPARITGTALLIGGELPLTTGGDPEADFKSGLPTAKMAKLSNLDPQRHCAQPGDRHAMGRQPGGCRQCLRRWLNGIARAEHLPGPSDHQRW